MERAQRGALIAQTLRRELIARRLAKTAIAFVGPRPEAEGPDPYRDALDCLHEFAWDVAETALDGLPPKPDTSAPGWKKRFTASLYATLGTNGLSDLVLRGERMFLARCPDAARVPSRTSEVGFAMLINDVGQIVRALAVGLDPDLLRADPEAAQREQRENLDYIADGDDKVRAPIFDAPPDRKPN
jgi:hypothetical protein